MWAVPREARLAMTHQELTPILLVIVIAERAAINDRVSISQSDL